MNYKNWTNEDKARFILNKLKDMTIPEYLLEHIQGWLLSEDNLREKNLLLEDIFDEMFQCNSKPSKRAYQLLKDLNYRIGLSEQQISKYRLKPARNILFRVAAVLLPFIILSGAIFLSIYGEHDKTDNSLNTESMAAVSDNAPTIIELPDGSTVSIVQGTQLIYADDFMKNRSVELIGEGFFFVRNMKGQPFTVTTEKITVSVLGTEFNLRAYPDESETIVSLTNGKVEITDNKKTIALAPMEQLIYDNKTGHTEIMEFELEHIGKTNFRKQELNDMILPEAMKAVAEFYGKKVVNADILSKDLMITTILSTNTPVESILQILRFMSGETFDYEIYDEIIFISRAQ